MYNDEDFKTFYRQRRDTMRLILPLLLLFQLSTLFAATNVPKLKLLYMQMQHCPWCHKMNKEIFENPNILQKLQKMYTIEKKFRGDDNLPDFVQPRYYPTTYIISADGKLLDELPGYMDPERFTDYLYELYELETNTAKE